MRVCSCGLCACVVQRARMNTAGRVTAVVFCAILASVWRTTETTTMKAYAQVIARYNSYTIIVYNNNNINIIQECNVT